MSRMLFLRDIEADVQMRCRSCGHEGVLARGTLERRFGPNYPLLSIGPHYRCSRCDSRDVESRPVVGQQSVRSAMPEQAEDMRIGATIAALQGLVDAARGGPPAGAVTAEEPDDAYEPPEDSPLLRVLDGLRGLHDQDDEDDEDPEERQRRAAALDAFDRELMRVEPDPVEPDDTVENEVEDDEDFPPLRRYAAKQAEDAASVANTYDLSLAALREMVEKAEREGGGPPEQDGAEQDEVEPAPKPEFQAEEPTAESGADPGLDRSLTALRAMLLRSAGDNEDEGELEEVFEPEPDPEEDEPSEEEILSFAIRDRERMPEFDDEPDEGEEEGEPVFANRLPEPVPPVEPGPVDEADKAAETASLHKTLAALRGMLELDDDEDPDFDRPRRR